jgi:hypothetical protein
MPLTFLTFQPNHRNLRLRPPYIDVVRRAELSDCSPAKGRMRSGHGYAIWELMQQALDCRFKATGHVNATSR